MPQPKTIIIPFPLKGVNANLPWQDGGGKYCNELTLNVMPYDRAKRSGGGVRPGTVLAYFQPVDVIAPPPDPGSDSTAPTATMPAQGTPMLAATSFNFNVYYADNVSLNTATFGDTDIHVTGPNAYAQDATKISVVNSDIAHSIVTYQIPSPGPAWDAPDDGNYTFAMVVSQVADTAGNFVTAGTLSIIIVNFTGSSGADTTRPTGVYPAQAGPVQATATFTFTVNYADNVALNTATFDSSDLVVTGPNAYSHAATYVSKVDADSAHSTATYSIPAPGGFWGELDNGTYTVSMQANQVADTSGNKVLTGSIGTFAVSFTPGSGGDDGHPPDPGLVDGGPYTCSIPNPADFGGTIASGGMTAGGFAGEPFANWSKVGTRVWVTSGAPSGIQWALEFEGAGSQRACNWKIHGAFGANDVYHATWRKFEGTTPVGRYYAFFGAAYADDNNPYTGPGTVYQVPSFIDVVLEEP